MRKQNDIASLWDRGKFTEKLEGQWKKWGFDSRESAIQHIWENKTDGHDFICFQASKELIYLLTNECVYSLFLRANTTETGIQSIEGENLIDSRILANGLDVKHKNLIEMIGKYRNKIESLGQLAFETEVGERPQGGGNPEKFYLLNRRQSVFIGMLSRNTERVVEFKFKLESEFYRLETKQANLMPEKYSELIRDMGNALAEEIEKRENLENKLRGLLES